MFAIEPIELEEGIRVHCIQCQGKSVGLDTDLWACKCVVSRGKEISGGNR
jgi:hypothetical protein